MSAPFAISSVAMAVSMKQAAFERMGVLPQGLNRRSPFRLATTLYAATSFLPSVWNGVGTTSMRFSTVVANFLHWASRT
jgi:hypothetical protein